MTFDYHALIFWLHFVKSYTIFSHVGGLLATVSVMLSMFGVTSLHFDLRALRVWVMNMHWLGYFGDLESLSISF